MGSITTLKRELENCIGAYNKLHQQQFTAAAATGINAESSGFQFSVKKNSKPTGELLIDFPINDGILKATGTRLPRGGVTYAIDPEVRNNSFVTTGNPAEAVYFVRGERRLRIPELVEELLSPLLFPQFSSFPE